MSNAELVFALSVTPAFNLMQGGSESGPLPMANLSSKTSAEHGIRRLMGVSSSHSARLTRCQSMRSDDDAPFFEKGTSKRGGSAYVIVRKKFGESL